MFEGHVNGNMGRLVRGTPSEGVCWEGILQAVRSIKTTAKVWVPTKSDATRSHYYQAMRQMRTAKGRHNYGRKVFEIDKMCVN